VKVVFGSEGSSSAPPAPNTIDHSPTPITGVLAARVVEFVGLHTFWSGPASAMVGVFRSKEITTWSVDGAQEPLVMVHSRVYDSPGAPWNTELGSEGFDITPPVPLTIVHVPVPTTGVFPGRLTGPQESSKSEPASAVVGSSSNSIDTSSSEVPHDEVIVPRRTYVVPGVPLSVVVGSASSARDPPAPLTMLH